MSKPTANGSRQMHVLTKTRQGLAPLLSSLRDFILRVSTGTDHRIDEPTLLEASIERKNQSSPGWDEAARRAALRRALKRGISRKSLVSTYGEDAVSDEEETISGVSAQHAVKA